MSGVCDTRIVSGVRSEQSVVVSYILANPNFNVLISQSKFTPPHYFLLLLLLLIQGYLSKVYFQVIIAHCQPPPHHRHHHYNQHHETTTETYRAKHDSAVQLFISKKYVHV